MQYFLQIISNDEHAWEWGCWSDLVPQIGDSLLLEYGIPDGEIDDAVRAVIVGREFMLGDNNSLLEDVNLDVRLNTPIPNGFVPNSPEWPCREFTKRIGNL